MRELGIIEAGRSKVVLGQEKEEDCGGIKEDKTIYHGMRLLSGYYRIIHTWSHLRTHPLQFDFPLLLAQLDINPVVHNHSQSSGKIKPRQRVWSA